MSPGALADLRGLVAQLPDPEIPVLSLDDLGILRSVETAGDGHVVITLTPTYTGCPAIDPICTSVRETARAAGFADAEVRLALAPAWTTDWMSEAGRDKLRDYGIAPPDPTTREASCLLLSRPPRCPRCGSADTREVSAFGSTPCQSQHVCNACLEPFDRFKSI